MTPPPGIDFRSNFLLERGAQAMKRRVHRWVFVFSTACEEIHGTGCVDPFSYCSAQARPFDSNSKEVAPIARVQP